MLLDAHLRERGLRDRTELMVSTVQPMLLPNAGAEGSAWLGEQLSRRNITWRVGRKIQRVEAGRLIFDDGELDVDLLIGVPPHRPPAVVKASGLTGSGDWVRVDPGSLETGHDGVYAIGDATKIELANRLPLPKAGLFAELEGKRVAAAIAAKVHGEQQPQPFDGHGYCFIETGDSNATLVKGDFYARPEPRIEVQEASPTHMAEKRRFEADRLERWFGAAGA